MLSHIVCVTWPKPSRRGNLRHCQRHGGSLLPAVMLSHSEQKVRSVMRASLALPAAIFRQAAGGVVDGLKVPWLVSEMRTPIYWLQHRRPFAALLRTPLQKPACAA